MMNKVINNIWRYYNVLEIRIPFKKFNANAFIDKMEVFADKIMDVCYAFP